MVVNKKYITNNEDGSINIDLKAFSNLIDISQIVYYELVELKGNRGLIITFYDKDNNKVSTNVNT